MTDEQRAARLARARFWIRTEFGIAILAVLAVAYVWIAQPPGIGPMFVLRRWTLTQYLIGLTPWLGIAGIVIGFAAMWWLSRLNPERGVRTWRYSDAPAWRRPRVRVRTDVAIVLLAGLTAGYLAISDPVITSTFRSWSVLRWLVPLSGLAGLVVGGGWLLRIAHDDPEGAERTWRHRR
jgi:hypothetical protein